MPIAIGLVTAIIIGCLFFWPKQTLIVAAMFVLFFLSAIILPFVLEERAVVTKAQAIAAIDVSAEFNADECQPNFPLKVTYINNNWKTTAKISLDIQGKMPGRSTVIIASSTADDHYTESGKTTVVCLRPSVGYTQGTTLGDGMRYEDLLWTVVVTDVTFQQD